MAANNRPDGKTSFYRKFSTKRTEQFENSWQFSLIFGFTLRLSKQKTQPFALIHKAHTFLKLNMKQMRLIVATRTLPFKAAFLRAIVVLYRTLNFQITVKCLTD